MSSFAYIGCWGGNERADEHGIHTYRWEPESGTLEYVASTLMNVRSGGMNWHPQKNILYIPNESAAAGFGSRKGSACIYAVEVDPESGAARELACVEAYGSNPAYVAVDASGKYLISANHGSPQTVVCTQRDDDGHIKLCRVADESNITLFKLNDAGVPEGPCDVMIYAPQNGERTSTHCTKLCPFANLIAVCDIEDGAVYMMGIDEGSDSLVVRGMYNGPEVSSARYCVFHPEKRLLFVNNEHGKQVTTLTYTQLGELSLVASVDVLPEEHQGPVQQSGIALTPDGKTLYSLIRAINSVAVCSVDDAGRLKQLQLMALDCVSPKDCAVSPDGKFLYVAGKVSGAMLCYEIGADGTLSAGCQKTEIPNPATIAFVQDGKVCR